MNGKVLEKKGLGEKIPSEVIMDFEKKLNPAYPEKSEVELRVIGYGEISTTFNIPHPCCQDLVFKRIPIFENVEQLKDYIALYVDYIELLEKNGIELPEHGYVALTTEDERVVFYDIQKLLPADSIGNKIIHQVSDEECFTLFRMVYDRLSSLWRYNASGGEKHLGLDGQISNWSLPDFQNHKRVSEEMKMVYIDVSTPMIKVGDQHLLNAELFLKSTPPGLRWIAKKFFLQDVLDRYHNLHLVLVDIIGNLYKEKREDLVPRLVDFTNDYIEKNLSDLDIKKLTLEEVQKYYKEDAFIWSFYLTARKIDRFIKNKILGKRYEFILPGKIER